MLRTCIATFRHCTDMCAHQTHRVEVMVVAMWLMQKAAAWTGLRRRRSLQAHAATSTSLSLGLCHAFLRSLTDCKRKRSKECILERTAQHL